MNVHFESIYIKPNILWFLVKAKGQAKNHLLQHVKFNDYNFTTISTYYFLNPDDFSS